MEAKILGEGKVITLIPPGNLNLRLLCIPKVPYSAGSQVQIKVLNRV